MVSKLNPNFLLGFEFSQFILETLRKYSPISILMRKSCKDYEIPNTNLIIEKDMLIFIPIYHIHYDPEIYENPHKFDPDRFLPESVAKRHPMAFLSFG